MNIQEVKELIGTFSKSDVTEMDLELADGHLVLKKSGNGSAVPDPAVPAPAAPALAEDTSSDDTQMPVRESSTALTEIKAPLAGIFYRSASPDAKPYVEAGQTVKKGDTIGLIEAMKVMNEIPAPHDGTIKTILAENESFVAFDEVLLQLEQI